MSLIGFSSHIAHATYPAEGTCIADITLNPELPTYFGLDNTANLTTPFFTTTATVNLTCTDTIYSEDVLFPVLEISGSNDIYPLLGGITGVSASLTNQTASSTCFKMQNIYSESLYFGNPGVNLLIVSNSGSTNLVGLNDPRGLYGGKTTCTGIYTFDINYYTNGQAFNNKASSVDVLTNSIGFPYGRSNSVQISSKLSAADNRDPFISFLKRAYVVSAFAVTSATGINSFTVGPPPISIAQPTIPVQPSIQLINIPNLVLPTSTHSSISMGLNSGVNTGNSNLFVGESSGNVNSTGNSNTFTGYFSGSKNTSGSENTLIGSGAGSSNTTGQDNVFFGNNAGAINTVGSNNLYIGHQSGRAASGNSNTLIGKSTGAYLSSALENTVIGYGAGSGSVGAALTGQGNSIFGVGAGSGNTSGQNNVYFGYNASNQRSSGDYNISIGPSVATNASVGSNNIYIGHLAGNSITSSPNTGFYNTVVGESAGGSLAGGSLTPTNAPSTSYNSFYGYQSGMGLTTGYFNIFMGSGTGGTNSSGWGNLAIGYNATIGGGGTIYNSVALGNTANVSAINAYQIGNSSVTSIGGGVSGLQWSTASDGRLKKDIHESNRGLNFVTKLRAVDYVLNGNNMAQTGFIAQEVEKVDPGFQGLIKPATNKDFYKLTYDSFIPSLVKSIQQLDQSLMRQSVSNRTNSLINKLQGCLALLSVWGLALGWRLFGFWKAVNNLKMNQTQENR